jgi:hypothetical protein
VSLYYPPGALGVVGTLKRKMGNISSRFFFIRQRSYLKCSFFFIIGSNILNFMLVGLKNGLSSTRS